MLQSPREEFSSAEILCERCNRSWVPVFFGEFSWGAEAMEPEASSAGTEEIQ
jgi:hypothetical protein